MCKNIIICSVSLLFSISCQEKKIASPESLSISEGFINPIGFYDATPTFSWKLPIERNIESQSAYQIVVASNLESLPDNPDLWNTEKELSSQSTFIEYKGKPITSGQKVYWQVRYWDQNDQSSTWSEASTFEMGLLSNDDWKAKWIGLDTAKDSIKGTNGVIINTPQYLRKKFELTSDVISARLYITAKGVFDVHLNGEDVSGDVMPPGWTPYNKRIETLTYDVTDLIVSGENMIAIELASGWHSGRLGWNKTLWENSGSPKVLCQLELFLKDGSKKTIISDNTWKATTKGPIRFTEIYDGETYDANYEMINWTTNNFDDKKWSTVITSTIDEQVKLEPKRHAAVKAKLQIPSKGIIKTENAAIFDLKQNMVGVAVVKAPMKKGDTLRMRFSEMLQPDGTFYTDNYRSAKSTDYYIASKDGMIEWAPKFTFHGFRYVELSGFDMSQEPMNEWVTGVVQYSDFEEHGTFTSSHNKLNQLQSNIVWGLRGNFFDIPTDCPQRDERLGWTGDAQVFVPTSIFNADVHAFWASWLQSLTEAQYENGGIPFVVPDALKNNKVSSGWGDAAVIIPWEVYYRTGNVTILKDNFEMMKAWVAHHQSVTNKYISDMNSFSDWLQPFPKKENNRRGDTSKNLISTAYFGYVTKLTAQTAKVLGKSEEQAKYEALSVAICKAFEKEFFDENGEIQNSEKTQTAYLLALGFDLLSPEIEEKAIPHLLDKIKEADNHLRTGFLGTPLLSKVLDDIGEYELMYEILFKETYPSWFYSINQGATTMWERWNSYSKKEGFNKQRMNSLNHYAYGAIGQWMYERIAGIAPLEAGYKKIRIAPVPGNRLTSASSSYDSPYGIIKSIWKLEGSTFNLEVTIPPNTTAIVRIPSKQQSKIYMDEAELVSSDIVKIVEIVDDYMELEVLPGTYKFKSILQ
ncbi:family 78 glycoside hydrolase catalytic domain [Spongiivirga citrea]|uniref:alpha-L-rhamnosidase n=1 Tax=Spongiivirga citrea TaxID=1481457 RepID=A0A6M0CIL7_9FLAO|nr:family 78 glycoside hydrolase catalytic domain [Spongiivirga citrea]